jgi:large repetitive protein
MAVTVTVGGTPATDVTVVSDTEVTATTPAGTAGDVDVVVTTSGGSDTLAAGFTYET